MTSLDILRLVLQPSITVLGWGIAAWWAVKQVNLANKKNLKLHRLLIRESHKRALANELIEIYKDVARSIHKLQQSGNHLTLNLSLEKQAIEEINFSAQTLVAPVNKTYNELSQNIFRLEIWLQVSKDHLPEFKNLHEAINLFNEVFSLSDQHKKKPPPWLRLQYMLVAYQAGKILPKNQDVNAWSEVSKHLSQILKKMTKGTAEVNKALTNSGNILEKENI